MHMVQFFYLYICIFTKKQVQETLKVKFKVFTNKTNILT